LIEKRTIYSCAWRSLVTLLVAFLCIGWSANYSMSAENTTFPFLFLETGEKFATQETAGPTVKGLTSYLGNVIGFQFEPYIFNRPQNADDFAVSKKPLFGIVTTGFYLCYRTTLGMVPLLEVKRAQIPEQRYVLIARKGTPSDLSKWKDKKIATTLAAENRYVIGVILEYKLGKEVNLVSTSDEEGSVLDMAEGLPNAADAVLINEAVWKLFEDDPDLVSNLHTIYRSNEMPHSIVVAFKSNANGIGSDRLKTAFLEMPQNEQGQQIMSSIRVAEFVEVNDTRLKYVQALYDAP